MISVLSNVEVIPQKIKIINNNVYFLSKNSIVPSSL